MDAVSWKQFSEMPIDFMLIFININIAKRDLIVILILGPPVQSLINKLIN